MTVKAKDSKLASAKQSLPRTHLLCSASVLVEMCRVPAFQHVFSARRLPVNLCCIRESTVAKSRMIEGHDTATPAADEVVTIKQTIRYYTAAI
jgi:hypothetical protein